MVIHVFDLQHLLFAIFFRNMYVAFSTVVFPLLQGSVDK